MGSRAVRIWREGKGVRSRSSVLCGVVRGICGNRSLCV